MSGLTGSFLHMVFNWYFELGSHIANKPQTWYAAEDDLEVLNLSTLFGCRSVPPYLALFSDLTSG